MKWTGQGYRHSWHMMMLIKHVDYKIRIGNPQIGEFYLVDLDNFLTPVQKKELGLYPDMFIQFIQYLKQQAIMQGIQNPVINSDFRISLYGQEVRQFIDPQLDLAKIETAPFKSYDWILPFKK